MASCIDAFGLLQAELDARYAEACKQITGTKKLFLALGAPGGAVAAATPVKKKRIRPSRAKKKPAVAAPLAG